MIKLDRNTKIVDVVEYDYTILPVLLRLGISPGFGEKNIEQVSKENDLDVEFVINILTAYIDKEYFPYDALLKVDTKLITEFLKVTHAFYKEEKIPELKQLFSALISEAKDKNNIKIIEYYFNSYLEEFQIHMEYEEKQVFPYAVELDRIITTLEASAKFIEGFKDFSIDEYQNQHKDGTQEKLNDLKKILLKYIPELNNYNTYYQVISKLFRLSDDLHTHMEIENKVLIPKLLTMAIKIDTLLKENKIEIK